MILPQEIDDTLISFLTLKRNGTVNVKVPKVGERKQLLVLVLKNIELSFFSEVEALEALKNELNLPEIPAVIESFDISHLSGTSTVGSMVQFKNAKPAKSNYRRFKIKTVDGIDDVGAIAEVVRRRYTRLVKEESELPDLIVIDGGIGQLNRHSQSSGSSGC